jgi:hypothetical protein
VNRTILFNNDLISASNLKIKQASTYAISQILNQ